MITEARAAAGLQDRSRRISLREFRGFGKAVGLADATRDRSVGDRQSGPSPWRRGAGRRWRRRSGVRDF